MDKYSPNEPLSTPSIAAQSPRGDGTASRIHDISVLTYNRPLLLRRCLASLNAHAQDETLAVRVRILDDAAEATSGHVGWADRHAMARQLADKAGVDEALVRFALCGMNAAGPGIGALRNTSLLLNVGRKYLQVDDDAICTTIVDSDADERRIELAREDLTVQLNWYSGSSAVPGDMRPSRDGFIEGHDRILGKTLADLARENDFRAPVANPDGAVLSWDSVTVRVTQNSLLGDCGMTSPWWKTLRCTPSTADGFRYRSQLVSRELLRKVNTIAVSRLLAPTAFAMGIDATHFLPPFLPSGRGEETVFVSLLNLMDEHACQAQLPAIVEHRPNKRPPFRHEEVIESITHLSVAGLINCFLVPGHSGRHGRSLEPIGAWLLRLCHAGWSSAVDELLPRVVARRKWMLAHLQSMLDDDLSTEQRADLERQIAALTVSIRRASSETLVQDISATEPKLNDEATILRYLRLFGELLQVWPHLWRTAAPHEFAMPTYNPPTPARSSCAK